MTSKIGAIQFEEDITVDMPPNEVHHYVMVSRERWDRIEAALRYAANMPDAENMPEWAKELRHRARRAIQPTPFTEEGRPYGPNDPKFQ